MKIEDKEQLLIQLIITEIEYKVTSQIDRLRLNYALLDSQEQKNDFTLKEYEITRNKIGLFDTRFSEYLRAGLMEGSIFMDDDESLETLTTNFVYNSIEESFYKEKEITEDSNIWFIIQECSYEDLIETFINGFELLGLFVHLKRMKDYQKENEIFSDEILIHKTNKNRVAKNWLFGKNLNISDRYFIANKVFKIEDCLLRLNILATEKHKLLSFLLGCNEQTARQLFNGTHQKRTPIQEDLVSTYLKNIDN